MKKKIVFERDVIKYPRVLKLMIIYYMLNAHVTIFKLYF